MEFWISISDLFFLLLNEQSFRFLFYFKLFFSLFFSDILFVLFVGGPSELSSAHTVTQIGARYGGRGVELRWVKVTWVGLGKGVIVRDNGDTITVKLLC